MIDLLIGFSASLGLALFELRKQRRALHLEYLEKVAVSWRMREEQRCPYCHDELEGETLGALFSCYDCDTTQHASCWTTHGRCSVHGCGGMSAHILNPLPSSEEDLRPRLEVESEEQPPREQDERAPAPLYQLALLRDPSGAPLTSGYERARAG